MKKRYFLSILAFLLLLVTVVLLPRTSANAATLQTDTYYYDHIPAQAQKCYRWLKEYYDSGAKAPGQYDYEFASWLPADATEAQVYQLYTDMIAGDMALKADDPTYQWKGRFSGYSYNSEIKPLQLTFTMTSYDLLTADIQARADARIQQIVKTVGTGDRYTQLRKLMHYLISTSFYDPYLDQINASGNHNFATRGIHYNASIYGVLLEGIAMCDGFSQTLKLLCNELDIPCIIMGNAAHGWNLVQMEDGKWYRLDLTNAVPLGWDGEMSQTLDAYFQDTFLNNNTLQAVFGTYDSPYMINADGHLYVETFPEHADGQYQYTGSTTDFSYTVAASTYTPGSPKFIYRVNSDGKTCTITNYEGKESGNLTIPGTLGGYTVTGIDPYAFYYCTGFTGKLTIPDSVKVIGRAAFAGCYGFTSVKLPANLQEIEYGAFIGCKGLTEVALPDLVDTVGDFVFYDCNNLRTITFGSHIQTIGTGVFDKVANGAVVKAPGGSVVQSCAANSGVSFQASGSLCAFRDVDGEWELDGVRHFHTCQHGARFDIGAHTNENNIFNCGDKCDVCKAEACTFYGIMKSAFTLINEKPATCGSMAYSGDLQCICGNIVQYGTFYGNATGLHTPADSQWEYDDSTHWQECSCGWQMDTNAHIGGTATTTEQAKCSVCGAAYGSLKAEESAPSTPPTEATEPEPSVPPTEPAPTAPPTEPTEPEPTAPPAEPTEPAPTAPPTEPTEPEPTAPPAEPSQANPTTPTTQPSQPEIGTVTNDPVTPDGGFPMETVLWIGLAVVVVAAGCALVIWILKKKKTS